MIKKLKIRFILLATLAAFAVIAVIISGVNIANFVSVAKNADELTEIIADGGGKFGGERGEENGGEEPPEKPNGEESPERPEGDFEEGGKFGPEAPFETRYFTVTYDGENYTLSLDSIAAVTEDEAKELYGGVISSGKTTGYSGVYRFRAADVENGKMVVFVDCGRQINTANRFLLFSILISLGGVAAVFFLSLIFSGKVIKPIAESYEKQRAFITDASHELKTPLTIISTNNELIALQFGENEYSDVIDGQIGRMNVLVKNMTALAKLDEGEKIERARFCVSDCLDDVIANFGAPTERNGLKVSLSIAKDEFISGDENLIRRLFSLVIDNAVKYSTTFIDVKLESVGGKVKITIENDAVGIKDGDQEKVFDRFYRSAEMRASGKEGSGIGLSVAKEIVNLHGGKIFAKGENGNFILTIIL
ncbi:MAG: HAMP domain-containing histidine kinase [Clostridia bacterium]|nr:HAMP domain-containing histidine kinase [Clostridia bacterium]